MGATLEDPPPGIGVIADAVDLAFADEVEALADALHGSDVLFAWRPRGQLLSEAWKDAADLRWIQSASAGVDALLFPELVRSRVVVSNARGVFDDAIAEYVVGLILLFSKGLIGVLDAQRRAEWRPRETERLEHKRVVVAGIGPIGRTIARSCTAMGMQVRGVGRTARPRDDEFGRVFAAEDLAEAVGWADYVVNALPATADTRRLFDAAVFAAMKPGSRFLNVGRGSTVDEPALVRALEEGRLGGAALDVFEEEPLARESPLWSMPNVVVSPHMAGDYAGWRESAVELFVRNLERYLTGRPLLNVVDKERGYVPS
ncbi:MAG TPA: D-2-hydroxyacid dehydrogenase [Actinomycetota bacterium]|nr:D-2-hydroxyacid dehydrogenase [Actinomycetota bacterium]